MVKLVDAQHPQRLALFIVAQDAQRRTQLAPDRVAAALAARRGNDRRPRPVIEHVAGERGGCGGLVVRVRADKQQVDFHSIF